MHKQIITNDGLKKYNRGDMIDIACVIDYDIVPVTSWQSYISLLLKPSFL